MEYRGALETEIQLNFVIRCMPTPRRVGRPGLRARQAGVLSPNNIRAEEKRAAVDRSIGVVMGAIRGRLTKLRPHCLGASKVTTTAELPWT